MLKLRSISKTNYDNYIETNYQSDHFMHSSSWAEFEKIIKKATPYYLGLIDENNNIIAATILIEEYLTMNNCTLYAPKGFALDYNDQKILTIFVKKLKDFAKKKKAISIKIDPNIIYKAYNSEENINPNCKHIINTLKELGFKKENSKNPKYVHTINLTKTKKFMDEPYVIELLTGNSKDLKDFLEKENDKVKNYYETLYDIFENNELSKIKLFICKLHITKTLKAIEKDLKIINNQISIIPIDHLDADSKKKLADLKTRKEKLSKSLEKFKEYKLEYGNYLTINTTLIMEHNNTAWLLKEQTENFKDEEKLKVKIHNKYINYYKDLKFEYFNTETSSTDINQDELLEYIGDYILITNKLNYFFQSILHRKELKEGKYGPSNFN